LEKWKDYYQGRNYYPLPNNNYVFKGIIIKKNRSNKLTKIYLPASEQFEHFTETEMNKFTQEQLDGYQIIDLKMFKEFELPFQNQNGNVVRSVDEEESEFENFPELVQDNTDDVVAEPIQRSSTVFKEGKGNPIAMALFNQAAAGRNTIKAFSTSEPIDIFRYLLDSVIIHTLKCTNNRIQAENELLASPITEILRGEFEVWLSCLVFVTIVQLPNMEMYWYPGEMVDYVQCPLATKITYSRYKEISKYLRYSNYDTEANENDLAWKVRTIFSLFRSSICKVQEAPSQKLSLDEAMGKCECSRNPIKHLEPNKPISCGFKFFVLVEYSTKVIVNIHLDDGEITYDNSKEYPYGATGRHVLRLMNHLPGLNYIVYMDNWYSSVPLAIKLLSQKIYMVATLRRDRGVIDAIKF